MIEPIEEEVIKHSEENLEHKEDAKEEPQPTDVIVHAIAGYSNPQTMKVGGLLKQQPITILIDTGKLLTSKIVSLLFGYHYPSRIAAGLMLRSPTDGF